MAGRRPSRAWKKKRRRGFGFALAVMAIACVLVIDRGWLDRPGEPDARAAHAWEGIDPKDVFDCPGPRIIDGDTLACGERRVRLQGIDAPEMEGHCRPGRVCTPGDPVASTDNLKRLAATGAITCRETDVDVYGRTVARCEAGGVDLSCAQVEEGYAVLRYAPISC